MKAAFLGPEGTFSEEALLASPDKPEIEPVAQPTIFDCVIAVNERAVDLALVPIENSLEGSVNATLDALVFETDQVRIIGELVHPVEHCLIARAQITLPEIERVISHPQASGQCAHFLREHLAGIEVVSSNSTADAVRLVAESEQPWAALGNRLSARIYGCEVLRERVEDVSENETRFVWLGLGSAPLIGSGENWKTSIVFWGLPDSPGSLVATMKQFSDRGVNLSKIESRPLKEGLGSYMFFADLEGRDSDEPVRAALEAVRSSAETLRVLGCYPAV